MEWLRQIIETNQNESGAIDVTAVMNAVATEFPKNAVPKEQYNNKVAELNTANSTLETLQAENKDVESLQAEIASHKAKIAEMQEQQTADAKKHAVEKALTKAGAQDVEYLAYKMGEVELDDNGAIKDIDNKLKELQENNPNLFTERDAKDSKPSGFAPVENGLNDGKPSDPIAAATAEVEAAMGVKVEK